MLIPHLSIILLTLISSTTCNFRNYEAFKHYKNYLKKYSDNRYVNLRIPQKNHNKVKEVTFNKIINTLIEDLYKNENNFIVGPQRSFYAMLWQLIFKISRMNFKRYVFQINYYLNAVFNIYLSISSVFYNSTIFSISAHKKFIFNFAYEYLISPFDKSSVEVVKIYRETTYFKIIYDHFCENFESMAEDSYKIIRIKPPLNVSILKQLIFSNTPEKIRAERKETIDAILEHVLNSKNFKILERISPENSFFRNWSIILQKPITFYYFLHFNLTFILTKFEYMLVLLLGKPSNILRKKNLPLYKIYIINHMKFTLRIYFYQMMNSEQFKKMENLPIDAVKLAAFDSYYRSKNLDVKKILNNKKK